MSDHRLASGRVRRAFDSRAEARAFMVESPWRAEADDVVRCRECGLWHIVTGHAAPASRADASAAP